MSNRAVRIATYSASAIIVAGLVAVAVPAVVGALSAATTPATNTVSLDSDSEPAQTTPSVNSQEERVPFAADGPGDCTTHASIHGYDEDDTEAMLYGELVDMGATDLASGPVGYNTEGLIATYTVQANDTLIGIGERFCIDYVTVAVYNHAWPPEQTIQPGEVLILRP